MNAGEAVPAPPHWHPYSYTVFGIGENRGKEKERKEKWGNLVFSTVWFKEENGWKENILMGPTPKCFPLGLGRKEGGKLILVQIDIIAPECACVVLYFSFLIFRFRVRLSETQIRRYCSSELHLLLSLLFLLHLSTSSPPLPHSCLHHPFMVRHHHLASSPPHLRSSAGSSMSSQLSQELRFLSQHDHIRAPPPTTGSVSPWNLKSPYEPWKAKSVVGTMLPSLQAPPLDSSFSSSSSCFLLLIFV